MIRFLLLAGLALGQPADTLPVPHAYQQALAAGTRARTGAPGPRYWQQRVAYAIRAGLDPVAALLRGEESVRYTNNSPDTLNQIVLNLGQNVFAPGNVRNRTVPITGGITLERVVLGGNVVEVSAPTGRSLPTVLSLPLARPLAPGATVELQATWSFTVPEGTFRMGRVGHEVFFLGQWYPQIAVYDDLVGWVRDPYMGDGEFYLEYGDFDVEVTVPEGWLVGASGELQNASQVLRPEAMARLNDASTDSIVHVVSTEDRDAGRSTRDGGDDGLLTWHFTARNVRDFAWGASDEYVWDATMADYSDGPQVRRHPLIQTLYRPDQSNWSQSAEFARHAIESHSTWFPYPYPQATVNEGVIGGGMEYPMITIIGGGRTPASLYSVIAHELGHMWWPMVVGSNEKAHAWMDEGLASFAENLSSQELFGTDGGLNDMNGYVRLAGSDRETPSMRHADLYGPFGNRGMASYGKPASVMRALRAVLGQEIFDRALREYTRRWAFKHPDPLDLFWTFEDVSGEDLDWFFYPWMYTTRVLDQAVAEVRPGSEESTIVLEDRGSIPMPVLLLVETADGTLQRLRQDVDAWQDHRIQLTVDGEVTSVVIDPDRFMPDVNRDDNRWGGD